MTEESMPPPPKTYSQFIERFPELGEAWASMARAGRNGPLDKKTSRLIKLAVAMGTMKEGAVHASVRKALSLGIEPDELYQVVALTASTIGLPAAVAGFCWIREIIDSDSETKAG